MNTLQSKRFWHSMLYLTIGVIAFSLSYCIFIAPQNIFAAGFTGLSQIVQYTLKHDLNLPIAHNMNLTGIVLWVFNLPLLLAAYKHLSKTFVLKTLYVVLLSGFIISAFPQIQPIVSDRLASCLVGGAIAGFGGGLILKSGGTSGGSDILGLLFSKKYHSLTVGKIGMFISLIIYTYLGMRVDIETAIYSVIYTFAASLITDKVHYQNIQTSAIIISKNDKIGEEINKELKRGVTHWSGCGEYTKEPSIVYMTIITKYEVHKLTNLVKNLDPQAFLIFDDNREVVGNFEKRFDA